MADRDDTEDLRDSLNAQDLPIFANTKPYEQMAIMMRAEGKEGETIAAHINAEYNLAYKRQSIYEWFMAGGKLEAAYMEYLEAYANQSLKMAKLKIKSLSLKATDTLSELLGPHSPSNVRQQAARTVLGKYIPDRQIVSTDTGKDGIPDELADAGDNVLKEETTDGQQPVDNPQEGKEAGAEAGAGGSETLS